MKKVSIIGMGALGLLYGSMIRKNCGSDCVEFLMDEERYGKYSTRQFNCNGEPVDFRLTKVSEAVPADLLIVAVKATGLEAAIRDMKNAVGKDTVIISVMNGITSEEMIGEVYGSRNLIYCVAQGMDAMKFGDSLSYTRTGELRIGITASGNPEALRAVEEFFGRAGIAYTEEDDIIRRLWGKFMLNVGINQTCMVYGTTYGGALTKGTPANRTLIEAMREVIAIANAEGIDLSEADLKQYINIIGTLSRDGMPSMAQDRINKRPSEVESFAGTVIRYAARHGIHVPENEFLYQKVMEIEEYNK